MPELFCFANKVLHLHDKLYFYKISFLQIYRAYSLVTLFDLYYIIQFSRYNWIFTAFAVKSLVEIKRFELLTPCLQGRCSPNWAIPPHLSHRAANYCVRLRVLRCSCICIHSTPRHLSSSYFLLPDLNPDSVFTNQGHYRSGLSRPIFYDGPWKLNSVF